jgi:hypothetical protein
MIWLLVAIGVLYLCIVNPAFRAATITVAICVAAFWGFIIFTTMK